MRIRRATNRQTDNHQPTEAIMKYLLFCCDSEAKYESMDDAEREALLTETFEYAARLRDSGQLLEGLPLERVNSAVTVRVRNGRPSATDGPFAETKEQIGGFLLIEAKDFNEAIRIASNWPPARLGSVEVRPVAEQLMAERQSPRKAAG